MLVSWNSLSFSAAAAAELVVRQQTGDLTKGKLMRASVIVIGTVFALFIRLLPASAQESLTGPIKEVRTQRMPIKGGTPDVIANILLEGYSVHITKETIIVFSDARKATSADLKVGKRVSARMASEIADTCPPQIYTDVIVIHVSAKSGGK